MRLLAVPLHHIHGGMHLLGDVDLVDDHQVGFGGAGAAFAGELVGGGKVDHVQGEVAQCRAEGGGGGISA